MKRSSNEAQAEHKQSTNETETRDKPGEIQEETHFWNGYYPDLYCIYAFTRLLKQDCWNIYKSFKQSSLTL